MNFIWLHRCRLLAGLLLVGLFQRLTPWARAEEPAWLKFDGWPEPSVGVEVEGSQDRSTINGATSTYNQASVTPLVGLEAKGSIYHPNLCTFDLNGQLGWGWENSSTDTPGSSQSQNDNSKVKRYLAQLNFLQQKPYNASFFATQDHTYQNFSSFNTLTVDSTRYGGGVNYFNDNFTLNADAGYWDQRDSGLTGYSEIAQTYYNLTGINYRRDGQTTFTTRGSHYENTLNSGSTQNSDTYGLGLSDSETFGSRKQITLTSGAFYGQSQYGGQQFNTVAANENLTIHHTPRLDSYGTLNYNHSDYQPVTDDRVQGLYGLRHQLYESLTSSVDVHGFYEDNNSGSGNSATYDSYGLGGAENYKKRLGSWGRLSVGLGMIVDHEDNDSVGSIQNTLGEPHTLALTGPPTYLNRPNVIQSTVVVIGPGGVVAQLNVDYFLTTVGALTQISLIATSAILSSGDVVRVNYESTSVGTASYEIFNSNFQVRLDLYNRYGLYARLNWSDNNAPPEVLVQTLTDWVGGADYTLHWFRAGVEFEDYMSDYTTYQAGRAFQNFSFKPAANSSLGLTLNESAYHYSTGGSQTTYQIFSHYQIQFLASLSWYSEAGLIYQDVLGTEQWTGTARTGLTWTRGKLSVRSGYDFNDQHTGSGQYAQDFIRNHFYLYLKRSF
jgi:hypothetical protein